MTGSKGITSCDGLADGNYQSCSGCYHYVSCSAGQMVSNIEIEMLFDSYFRNTFINYLLSLTDILLTNLGALSIRIRVYAYSTTCILLRVFYYVYSTTCILLRVFYYVYSTTCILLRVFYYVYSTTCILLRVFYYVYSTTCILLRVFYYVYSTTCILLRVFYYVYSTTCILLRVYVYSILYAYSTNSIEFAMASIVTLLNAAVF